MVLWKPVGLLAWTSCVQLAACWAAVDPSPAMAREVRVLVVIGDMLDMYGSEDIHMHAMEIGAAQLQKHWTTMDAAEGQARTWKMKLFMLHAGGIVAEAASRITAAIDELEPCFVAGSTSLNPELTHLVGHIAMYKHILFAPLNDFTSRTMLDSSVYSLTVDPAAFDFAMFLHPFMALMGKFAWKRAVIVMDASAAGLSRQLNSVTADLDISFVFVSASQLNAVQEFYRILNFIEKGHYSVIGVSLPNTYSIDWRIFFDMAVERGLHGKGYQWCFQGSGSSLWPPKPPYPHFQDAFIVWGAFNEIEESNPAAWTSGMYELMAASMPDLLAEWLQKREVEHVVCSSTIPCDASSSGSLRWGGLVFSEVRSGVNAYVFGAIARAVMDNGLCGSAPKRVNATVERLLNVASTADIEVPFFGRVLFKSAPTGLRRAATCIVTSMHRYDYLEEFPVTRLMKEWEAHRALAVISRSGEVYLMDGYLNIPAHRFEEVFGKPFSFMGDSSSIPRDYVPDSCGRKAIVNGSLCLQCNYGYALPMNGTNDCLPAAEPCKDGYVWSYADIMCLECKPGSFAIGGACKLCSEGRSSSAGQLSCDLCSNGFYMPSNSEECRFCVDSDSESISSIPYIVAGNACIMDLNYPVWFLSAVALTAALAVLLSQLSLGDGLSTSGRILHVEDVSLEQGQGVVTTLGGHGLRLSCKQIRLVFRNTNCGVLDDVNTVCYGNVLSADRIALFDKDGRPLTGRLDAAQGSIRMRASQTLMYTGTSLPVLVPLAIFLMVAVACISAISLFEIAVSTGGSFLVAVAASSQWKRKRKKSTLERVLEHFSTVYVVGAPLSVPRGAERAMSAGCISGVYTTFRQVVKDRNMYFLLPNMVIPVTAPHRLSFAEVVGPMRINWFTSHWWGHSFAQTVTALQKHAMHPSVCQGQNWRNAAYWICTFANNQHQVNEELGQQCTESSFYLALWSGHCSGTCLILDEHVHPLKRSWCLFEFVQTVRIKDCGEDKLAAFKGLFFCTDSGVLNFGQASVEMSLRIGETLATLSLEDASASRAEDKKMIDTIVEKDMGGFNATNELLRSHISTALGIAKASSDDDFSKLFSRLSKDTYIL